MAKGISLHIGLNFVNPKHYAGWNGELTAPEFDANDMQLICNSEGFRTKKLLREKATIDNVLHEIHNAAADLQSGDIFCITYSGHGGQLPDLNSDEDDDMDETWCLFDGQLVDDKLGLLWTLFQENVRILVIADSCHSGTGIKSARHSNFTLEEENKRKYMPNEVATTTYYDNKKFYDEILKEAKSKKTLKASVKLISGCQDNQYSYDGTFNGQFTSKLKRAWNGGKFNGNYHGFHKNIMDLLPPYQTPNLYNIGLQNITFDNQKPFTI